MTDLSGEFRALQIANSERERQRAFDDQQHEVAGRDVGRRSRFLNEDGAASAQGKQRREARAWSALEQLLSANPAYRTLYDDVLINVNRAALAARQALDTLERQIADSLTRLDDMRDAAHRLPDGTLVFRAAYGRVFTEDGRSVANDELTGVVWREEAPTWEDFQSETRRVEEALAERDAILGYQRDVLEPAQERLGAADDLLSPQELQKLDSAISDFSSPVFSDAYNELDPGSLETALQETRAVKLDLPEPGP